MLVSAASGRGTGKEERGETDKQTGRQADTGRKHKFTHPDVCVFMYVRVVSVCERKALVSVGDTMMV
jgi:hypothetical protein